MKTILITGCSSGIGYVCAKELKKDGYNVLATARKAQDVARLKDEGLNAFQLDISNQESILSAVEWVKTQTDKIDFLFNNAGYAQPGAVEDLTMSLLRQQFDTNLFGAIFLTNQILKLMREQGSGRVIFNSSILGFVAMSYRGSYNASKFAMEGLVDTLRLELYNTNIKVALIQPGPITSDFRKNALAKFRENIDINSSFHKEIYIKTLKRLESEEKTKFELSEFAVLKALKRAMEDKNVKARYQVTTPTVLMWYLKKLLPTKLFDRLAIKAGD
ncbi:SDR family NAD(P)-dependent oxidoreductase [Campylobacter geochelonis]|uniref:SDR family NAD(P)-dependent oxidoreductase n=1 Tax=Campylobacter geochelonis TaxID=1780362 RepID=UPI0007708852|nr:SDR family NAD(P)-dependent oxidoreductase [Campylobacter geochelonis]CZE51376.1 Oxidoreductase [Campylobacter geochelonis]